MDEEANDQDNEGGIEVPAEPEAASSRSASPVIASAFPSSTPPVEPAAVATSEEKLIVPEDIKKEEVPIEEKPVEEEKVVPVEAKPENELNDKVAEITAECPLPAKEEPATIKLEPLELPPSPENKEEKAKSQIPPPPPQPLLISAATYGGFLPPGPPYPPSMSLSEPPLDVSNQNEPQNLKIKQEIIIPPPPTSDMMIDPLQQLKEVKVPGYSPTNLVSTAVSQPLPPNSQQSESSFVDIKKECIEPPKSPKPTSRSSSPRMSPALAQATAPIRPAHSPLGSRASPSAPSPSAAVPMVPISSAMGIPQSMAASSPFVTHPGLLHAGHHPSAHHHAPHPLSYHPFHPAHHHPAYPYAYPFPYPYPHMPPQLPPRMQSVPPSGAPEVGPTPPRPEEQPPSAPSTPSSSHKKHHRYRFQRFQLKLILKPIRENSRRKIIFSMMIF